MTNATATLCPTTPLDHLYAVERHIENAEQLLMHAVEQLVMASEAHTKAANTGAPNTCPAFYAKIQDRLTHTIDLMSFRAKLGV